MKRRTLIAAVTATALLSGCIRDRYFDLEWDEEVQLHDGRVIVVHLKHTYERIEQGFFTTVLSGFSPYAGTILPRDTTLTFDAGGTTGKVTQLFKGYHPLMIDQYNGTWFAVIDGSDYYRSKEIPGQDWGVHWYDCSPAVFLQGMKFEPMLIHDLPSIFEKSNVLWLSGDVREHALLHGTLVTLQDKAAWLRKHPPGYGHGHLCHPPKNVVRPTNIFDSKQTQGVKK